MNLAQTQPQAGDRQKNREAATAATRSGPSPALPRDPQGFVGECAVTLLLL